MTDYYIAPRGVLSTQAVIDRKELMRLRELAMIGQAYEAAMRTMRGRLDKGIVYDALREFADEVRKERNARAVATTEAGRHPDL